MGSILISIALILAVGVSNDVATIPQMLSVYFIAAILCAIGLLITRKEYESNIKYFHLCFVAPNGTYKRVRARTYAGRAKAIRDYESAGYILYSESEEYVA